MKGWAWGGVALWLVVVAAGSALAWVAIDRAGRQVTAAPGPSFAAPTTVVTATSPPTASPRPTTAPAPSGPRTTTPTRSPDSAIQDPAPTTPRTPSAPASPRTSSPAAQPTRFGTWTGAAGQVTVSCTGSRARLVGATPADGWRVERKDSGDEIRVEFERGENEVRVRATCTASGPAFRVETEDSSDD